jgi:hypothetical protein
MDTIGSNDIKNLLQNGDEIHVSIIMPTHHKGGVDQQDLIRFKNLLRSAEEKMVQKGLRMPDARAILKPVEPLLTDSLFWRQQGDGLAIFLLKNRLMYYRLPLVLEEMVEVGKRFYIRPLIPLLSKCGLFYVLAVSQNENRLLQCSPSGSVRVSPTGIPGNMAEALRSQVSTESESRVPAKTATVNATASAGIQSEASGRVNINKEQILPYLEQVNRGVAGILKFEQSPLVLAGLDFLHPLYQKVNTYPHLLQQGISGNPEGNSDTVLRDLAWPLVNGQFEKEQIAALAEYRQAAGTGKTAEQAGDVVTASVEGRTRFLFIAEGMQYRGSAPAAIVPTPKLPDSGTGNEDLIDLAVYNTLKHGGTVFVIKPQDMPVKAALLALLRY